MQVFRICKRIYATDPFSGEGSRFVSGRWHQAGQRVAYTAATLSLAAWELWVHLPKNRQRSTYVYASAFIPDDLRIEEIREDQLSEGWREFAPYPGELRLLGSSWLLKCRSAVLRVPSAVVPGEFNYLLNPLHEDFAIIERGDAKPFVFDPRVLSI